MCGLWAPLLQLRKHRLAQEELREKSALNDIRKIVEEMKALEANLVEAVSSVDFQLSVRNGNFQCFTVCPFLGKEISSFFNPSTFQ